MLVLLKSIPDKRESKYEKKKRERKEDKLCISFMPLGQVQLMGPSSQSFFFFKYIEGSEMVYLMISIISNNMGYVRDHCGTTLQHNN